MYLLFLFTAIFVRVGADSAAVRAFPYSQQEPLDFASTCPNHHDALLKENPYNFCTPNPDFLSQFPENSTSNEFPSWESEQLHQCLSHPRSPEDYCIHASSSFSGNRGISIIATPSSTSIILNSTGFKAPPKLYPTSKSSRDFYETALPGRGKGLIANCTFHRGDLVLSSAPVLIIDEAIFDTFSDEERFPFQRKAVESLPPATKKILYGLAGHFGGDRVEDIIRTNAFGTTFGGVGKFGVIVPEAARLNHDCRPNARFAFDPESLSHKVHAVRTIHPGEELTISYIDEKQEHAARQKHIHGHWGFHCTCNHCSLAQSQRMISDERIIKMVDLRKRLLGFSSEGHDNGSREMALELIELYREEKLHAVMAEAYMLAALRFCAWNNEEKTKELANLALDNWLVWEKKGEGNRQMLGRVAASPRDTWCWNLGRNLET